MKSGEEGADFLFIYSLADRLGKTAVEVLTMSIHEREGWLAYLSHLDDLHK